MHLLLFLNCVLKKVDAMNVEFQSEHFRLDKLYSMICCEYRNILRMLIKEDVLVSEKLSIIDIANPSLHVTLNKLNVGGRCKAALLNEPLGVHLKTGLDLTAYCSLLLFVARYGRGSLSRSMVSLLCYIILTLW